MCATLIFTPYTNLIYGQGKEERSEIKQAFLYFKILRKVLCNFYFIQSRIEFLTL